MGSAASATYTSVLVRPINACYHFIHDDHKLERRSHGIPSPAAIYSKMVQNNAQEINLQGNRLREAYIAAAGVHLGISVSATVTVCMHVPHSVTV